MMSFYSNDSDAEVESFRDSLKPRVQALNVERKEQRFSLKNDTIGPPIATWRSNLAVSSQRRNLLFVAHGCDIHVWIPLGPFQLLGSQAEMVIKPVMKQPLADGYIDPTNPHVINNILVDELGRDEVLLLATDSGNVCGYHVEAIFSAIKRCTRSGYRCPFDGAEVTPFFVENVGMSAWGLAIHKFARLIAISANTGQITVYAFALVDPSSGDIDVSTTTSDSEDLNATQSDQTWVSIHNIVQLRDLQKSMPRNHRSRNLRLTYRGHFDNIPNISFANFDLDSNGSWMASTDISNRVIIWRIWDDLGPYRVYYPGHPLNNPPQRGWTVIPLDPRTFRRHQDREDACGCKPGSALLTSRTIVDLSPAIREVSDASQIFLFGSSKANRPRDLSCGIATLPDLIFSAIRTQEGPQPDFEAANTHNTESKPKPEEDSDNDSQVEGTASDSSDRVVRVKRPLASLFEEESEPHPIGPCLHPDYIYDLEGFSDDSLKLLSERPVHPVHPPQFFPTIHFSEHHISMAPYPIDSDYHLLCRNPLFQRYSFNVEMSSACDRFNMVKYVPELGIIVAASQKGRVAIITLTWQEEIGYAFRLDRILPFHTQECSKERPLTPLLGMAVSPMPGYEIPPDVPCIPRGVDPDGWLQFKYRILNPEDDDASSSSFSSSFSSAGPDPLIAGSASQTASSHFPRDLESGADDDDNDDDNHPENHGKNSPSSSISESKSDNISSNGGSNATRPVEDDGNYTLPELHAHASRVYRPQEHWHGWHPSRHYRIMLLYCDHTVMSYEFWHDWRSE